MDRLTLLAAARAAGLTQLTEGDLLIIRGPGSVESLAQELRARKHELLAPHAGSLDERQAFDDPKVLRRVAAMRARHPLTPGTPLPFLTARDLPPGSGGCRSCGKPVAPLRDGLVIRCQPCALAARIVTAQAKP